MTEENPTESVFETANVSEEMPTEVPKLDEETEEVQEEWKPTISNESPKDRKDRLGTKKEMDGSTLTVKSVFFTRPKIKNPDGTKIEPKKTQSGEGSFYPGKLGIRFEEDNLVEYYPNFHYFINEDGAVNSNAKINRNGNNEVSKLFVLVVAKMGKPMDEISDQDVYDFLVGKKVKIQVTKGTYLGKNWFRNNIVEILD